MQMFIEVYVLFEVLDEDGGEIDEAVKNIRSRRSEVHSANYLQDTLNHMAGDFELHVEQTQLDMPKI